MSIFIAKIILLLHLRLSARYEPDESQSTWVKEEKLTAEFYSFDSIVSIVAIHHGPINEFKRRK